MKFWIKTKWKLVLFGGLLTAYYLYSRPPSEEQMLLHFKENRIEFEQLRAMLQQDKGLEYINFTGFGALESQNVTPKFSERRLKQYRILMKNLGLQRVVKLTSRGGYFRFGVFGGGFTDTSWGIGYAWSENPLLPQVSSAYNQMPMRDDQHFSRIEGKWHIYHRR